MRGNIGFVFIEIFLSHNKEFQPYPSGCGESQTILRRMTSVPRRGAGVKNRLLGE